MEIEIGYNGQTIQTVTESGTVTLNTAGKFMTDNITLEIDAGSGSSLITFYIWDVYSSTSYNVYQAEAGMTFRQFIDSEYNTDGFRYVESGDIYRYASSTRVYLTNSDITAMMSMTATIVDGYDYHWNEGPMAVVVK